MTGSYARGTYPLPLRFPLYNHIPPHPLPHLPPHPHPLQIPLHPSPLPLQPPRHLLHKPPRTPYELFAQPNISDLLQPRLPLRQQFPLGRHVILLDRVRGHVAEQEHQEDDEAGAVFALRAVDQDGVGGGGGEKGEDGEEFGGGGGERVDAQACQAAGLHGGGCD